MWEEFDDAHAFASVTSSEIVPMCLSVPMSQEAGAPPSYYDDALCHIPPPQTQHAVFPLWGMLTPETLMRDFNECWISRAQGGRSEVWQALAESMEWTCANIRVSAESVVIEEQHRERAPADPVWAQRIVALARRNQARVILEQGSRVFQSLEPEYADTHPTLTQELRRCAREARYEFAYGMPHPLASIACEWMRGVNDGPAPVAVVQSPHTTVTAERQGPEEANTAVCTSGGGSGVVLPETWLTKVRAHHSFGSSVTICTRVGLLRLLQDRMPLELVGLCNNIGRLFASAALCDERRCPSQSLPLRTTTPFLTVITALCLRGSLVPLPAEAAGLLDNYIAFSLERKRGISRGLAPPPLWPSTTVAATSQSPVRKRRRTGLQLVLSSGKR